MICKVCESEVAEGNEDCPECGAPLSLDDESAKAYAEAYALIYPRFKQNLLRRRITRKKLEVGYRLKMAFLAVIYVVSAALLLYGYLGTYYAAPDDIVAMFIGLPSAVLFLLKMTFDFLYYKFGKKVFYVFSIIFAVAQFYSVENLVYGILGHTPYYCVFIGCCFSAFSLLLCSVSEPIVIALNIGYSGEKPISFGRKVAEVFLQLALLPISVIIQVFAIPYAIMGFHFLGTFIIEKLFYVKMKREEVGCWISNSDLVQNGRAMVHAFIALPCRIFSLVLSILALFIPNLFVSAILPKGLNEGKYDFNERFYELTDALSFDE